MHFVPVSKKQLKSLVEDSDDDSSVIKEGCLKSDLCELDFDINNVSRSMDGWDLWTAEEIEEAVAELRKNVKVVHAKGTKFVSNDGGDSWNSVEGDSDDFGSDFEELLETVQEKERTRFVVREQQSGLFHAKSLLQDQPHYYSAKDALRIVRYRNGDTLPYRAISVDSRAEWGAVENAQLEAFEVGDDNGDENPSEE